jgi:hypothetical protein
MSENENFLDRWSRRKRGVADEADLAKLEDRNIEKDDTAVAARVEGMPQPEAKDADPKPFDPADLPSIESIGADTDVRGFLQAGVPEELKRAALRRAWSTDPAIRDFVGLVENGWDFNDPNAMHGFGPIAVEDVARLLDHAVGALPQEQAQESLPEPAQIAAAHEEMPQNSSTGVPTEPPAETTSDASTPSESTSLQCDENDDAVQKESKA